MFEQVATKLLEGAFLCESTAPEAFRWLNTEAAQQEVAEYLGKLGRRLSRTPNDQAYYATWKRITQGERSEVKKVFTNIKQSVRPVIHFITLCMEAVRKDITPSAGDRLEYANLLKTITTSSHLNEMLREFATMGKEFAVNDASTKSMLDKVIQQMERGGYLINISREHETYRFTGKLDYYYQVVDFLMENEQIADPATNEQDTNPDQARLI